MNFEKITLSAFNEIYLIGLFLFAPAIGYLWARPTGEEKPAKSSMAAALAITLLILGVGILLLGFFKAIPAMS